MQATQTVAVSCDVCHQGVAGGLRKWRRHLPSHDAVQICASCSYRLTRSADGRGIESEDMMHMVSVYRTLAGEVWSDADRVYWYRQPFMHRSPDRLAAVLDREQPALKLSDLTRKELIRAGVRL